MSGDPDNDFESGSGLPDFVFDEGSNLYWKQMRPDLWYSLRDAAIKRELKFQGLHDKPIAMNGEVISQIDAKLREIEQEKRVKFACALAGYKAGIHHQGGEDILIPRSPALVQPEPGEWPVLAEVIDRLFVGEEVLPDGDTRMVDQRDRWLAWMQHWLQSLHLGRVARGLCLCIAGEPNSGKTLLAKIMKALTGDKEGKPYDFMIGRDNFNRELFEASLQLIDDENADTNITARREFGSHIKKIVANDDLKLRGMHRDGVVLSPNWRIVALVNLEAERLMVMPPVENDIADKILMLKGHQRPIPEDKTDRRWPMPMPTDTPMEQDAFWRTLKAEFPAFVHFLLHEYRAPAEVSGGRFGVRAWQHPEILRELQQFSPHVRLWQLIFRSGVVFRQCVSQKSSVSEAVWEDVEEWTGSAEELLDLLRSTQSKLNEDERREVHKLKGNWAGVQLRAASKAWGTDVVEFRRTGKGRQWRLVRRPDLIQ